MVPPPLFYFMFKNLFERFRAHSAHGVKDEPIIFGRDRNSPSNLMLSVMVSYRNIFVPNQADGNGKSRIVGSTEEFSRSLDLRLGRRNMWVCGCLHNTNRGEIFPSS